MKLISVFALFPGAGPGAEFIYKSLAASLLLPLIIFNFITSFILGILSLGLKDRLKKYGWILKVISYILAAAVGATITAYLFYNLA